MTSRRLNTGGLIDRTDRRRFMFDGRHYDGCKGDTLASALLANGVQVVGRSFKYHRPRGLWGAWVDDPNAVMDITYQHKSFPNCPAATTYLEPRMEARAVNAWPSANFDIKSGLDLFHRWLGAGFYYKTFMWPDWHLFEPMIRKMAGLGSVSTQVLHDYHSDQQHRTCDLLVVGGGPAGLTAAREAAQAGQDVLIVDDHDTLGGSAYQQREVNGIPAATWVTEQLEAIRTAGGEVLARTTAFGVYDHGLFALAQDTGFGAAPKLWTVRPYRALLATGALDRPVTFGGNDRPGVMSLSAAAEYLARYGVLVAETICVLSNNSISENQMSLLESAGARIKTLDPNSTGLSTFGVGRLAGIKQGSTKHFAHSVLTSAGHTPLVHLWRHAGGKLAWDDAAQAFLPADGPATLQSIGAANGTFDLDRSIEEARASVTNSSFDRSTSTYRLIPIPPKTDSDARQWIDFQHDVTVKDIAQAVSENYTSVEHLKRYTTLGMATDQGKTSNMAGLATMAHLQGRNIPDVGTTTFRPPYTPVPLALYRGHHTGQDLHAVKRLQLEAAHRRADAALGEYGGWLRPAWYGEGPSGALIQEEAATARRKVGLFDASPLGKIEVMGPDAADFLNFVYYNTITTLKQQHIRYGFMLTEGGTVYDDGVVTRLGDHHFVVSCSSSHVAGVYRLLQLWRQDGNDPDRIFVHDGTAQWATLTLTGPNARQVLADLELEIELDRERFGHMQYRETSFEGSPMRVSRVSFTGDLSFELAVPADKAQDLWHRLLSQGEKHGIVPIGLEAVAQMRAEKGYIIIGRDTDGMTMPHDLGFDLPLKKKTAAYIGDRSLKVEAACAAGRRQLVGLRVSEGQPMLSNGAHVVSGSPPRSIGIVTSSYENSTSGEPIALALLEDGAARHGETVQVYHLGKEHTAEVAHPCRFDPEGGQLNA